MREQARKGPKGGKLLPRKTSGERNQKEEKKGQGTDERKSKDKRKRARSRAERDVHAIGLRKERETTASVAEIALLQHGFNELGDTDGEQCQ